MLTSFTGLVLLVCVLAVAIMERGGAKLGFLDIRAAIVVFGGVLGALFVAMDGKSLLRMVASFRELYGRRSPSDRDDNLIQDGMKKMSEAWVGGRRAEILAIADTAPIEELRVAADCLLRYLSGHALSEQFTRVRSQYVRDTVPVIEGWEMVGKLAPSFGMVGTVTGMVQLFKNMAENTGNLGGAMAMALLATLYGISLGAAVGGPMASRVNKQFNSRLALIDLLEKTVASLVECAQNQAGKGNES